MTEIIRIALTSTLPGDTVNMYLIKAEPLTLIDAGFNNADTRERLSAALQLEGLRFRDIQQVILTHTHPDHVGLAAELQATGARIIMHPQEWAKIQQGTADNGQILRWAGVPAAVVPGVRQNSPREVVYPTEVEFLPGGDTLNIGHLELQVIHTPGHSSGLICLYDPREQCIFTGDHIVPHFSPALLVEGTAFGRTDSYNQYLSSLQRIADLPVRQVYPGHGDPFSDFRAAIQRLYQAHERKLARLAGLLTSESKTAFTLVRELSPGLNGFIHFFAAGDTIAHLDKLVELGQAVLTEEDGTLLYRKPE